MKEYLLEFKKIKGQHIFTIMLLVLLVLLTIGLKNLYQPSGRKGIDPIFSGIFSISGYHTIILPLLLAVLASRLADIEYKGSCFKLLLTQMTSKKLYFVKYCCGLTFVALFILVETGIFFLIACMKGYNDSVHLSSILVLGLITLIVSLPVLALQQFLSLTIFNQMVPMVAGIGGGFLGLISLLFPPSICRFSIWSYYSLLSPSVVHIKPDGKTAIYAQQPISIPLLIIAIVLFLFLFFLGQHQFAKKEF